MKTPILGQHAQVRFASENRMMNLFPEAIQEGGKESAFLTRVPNLRQLFDLSVATFADGGLRAMHVHNGVLYLVHATKLLRVTVEDGSLKFPQFEIGTVAGTGRVSIADNGVQLFMAAGEKGYVYNTQTGVFGEITDGDFAGASTVTYLDGYFIFNQPNSQKIWATSLLDGTTIDPLDFASAEGSSDNTVAVVADHRELWVFGDVSTEVFTNTGGLEFPLTRLPGAFNEVGCVAAHSVAKIDNGLFWLGCDARGQGIVYRVNGYTGTRVSTHAIEREIQRYGDISDAFAFTYQSNGHSFYCLTFPTAGKTWVYDVATNVWHERGTFVNGDFTRWVPNCHVFFLGKHIVGDYRIGRLYELTDDVVQAYSSVDSINPLQKWVRSWRALPTGTSEPKATGVASPVGAAHLSLKVDMEVGFPADQSKDYVVSLRWSDDGGKTWSDERLALVGRGGDYGNRVIWRRLGSTRKLCDRVYEISGTDPMPITITGAELVIGSTLGG